MQMTINPICTSVEKFEVFWTSKENLVTWNLFSIEGAQQFREPLKQLCARMSFQNALSLFSRQTEMLTHTSIPWAEPGLEDGPGENLTN